MCKHVFYAPADEQAIRMEVVWKPTMRHYNLNIRRADVPQGEEHLMYDSTSDARTYREERGHFRGGLTLQEVQDRFRQFHLTPPEGLLAALEEDAYTNSVDVIRHW